MTDQELKELVSSLAIAQAKTDEQLKKTDEQLKKTDEELRNIFKKTDERLDRVAKQLGSIAKNQGDVAEEYFVNSLKESLRIGNLDFDLLLENVGLKTKKINDEFDILLVNGESVALIEVKYKVHPNDLDRLPKKIEHLKLMPQYRNYNIYAGVAGFFVPSDVIEEAEKRGYFVLQRKGDVIVSYADKLRAA